MRGIFIGFAILLALPAFAQLNPVKWTFAAERTGAGEYELVITAAVNNGWYIYSQHLEAGGPIPTTFQLTQAGHYKAPGKFSESGKNRKEGYDELFGMNVVKYAGEVIFRQRIQVNDPSKPVDGQVEFMTCDNDQCLPPRSVKFRIPLTK